ncbi:hypothetical protein SAMN05444507_10514 [Pseudomonas syringae]|uniref:Uncharacterized protein n=1 Tax=Pseudomonas syringae pv. syringae TaxID=321 RepID=A0AAE5S3W9_PSESY|nr:MULTISPECIES: hypothetical protein [Pseudomonas syringae group]POQ01090.1 hypothetical protein CXB42_23770 [Pseudomonas syringae pv. syringae]RMM59003.1 hypothetical protein ALQ76_05102 [Pseudomonas syringae pv. atrofaciens]SFI03762.1 hypothetical protein SAMN05444507_10514 [Pseudomonas syringae]
MPVKYNNIRHTLKTVFCSDFNMTEDVAIDIYVNSLNSSGKTDEMRYELAECLRDQNVSWRDMLVNDEYEVLDFETEQEAKDYIKRILWQPLDEKTN